MANGSHCPECGEDVGFWAIALGMVRIRCPRCRVRLYHRQSAGMSRATSIVAFAAVIGGLAAGAVTGWGARADGPIVALIAGIVICAAVTFGLGLLSHIALTPALRRTQRLVRDGERSEPSDEELW
jgi:hypothetical protein